MEQKNDILCSIVIPSYNVEQYIMNCIDSVQKSMNSVDFRQTEIIIVNDGSTDNTGKIAADYAMRYPNVLVVNQPNAGLSGARNSGIRAASGKYIIFADADDFFAPTSLSTVYNYLRENTDVDLLEYDNYELLKGGRRVVKSGDFTPVSGRGQSVFHLWNKASLPHYVAWTRAVSRNMLLSHGLFFYDRIIHEDEEWVPRLFAYAEKAAYLPVPVYVYRDFREDSIMSRVTKKNFYDLLKVFDSLIAFDRRNNFSPEYSFELKRRISSIYWMIFYGLNIDGTYDKILAEELRKREYIIKYSTTMHRRVFYKYILKVFGVRTFYTMKYGIKKYFWEQ